ncbi:MAG: DUF448 domain-containing protein [Sphingomonadaceae bacterium]
MRKPRNERLGREKYAPAEARPRNQAGPRSSPQNGKGRVPERTCIVSRRKAPQAELIRLALGPDGTVHPDIRARAPGRGAWIGADRAELEGAQAKGRLKEALARAFKTGAMTVPDDLPLRIEQALRQAALDRLGLEARAGTLLSGSERIERAARKGEVELVIHAADAAADGRKTLDQAWRAGGRQGEGLVFPADRAILSAALGRQNVVHIALTDRAAAERVLRAMERWRAFIGPDFEAEADAAAAASARI